MKILRSFITVHKIPRIVKYVASVNKIINLNKLIQYLQIVLQTSLFPH